MGSLWTAVDPCWTYRTGPKTDPDGWMYAFGMNAGTWEATNHAVGSFVRKREWARQYQ
jgi:hypothetical protein